MLLNDINLNIRSGNVRYNNKILVSDSVLSVAKNDMVNTTLPEKTSAIVPKHKHKTLIIHAQSEHTLAITYEKGKVAVVLVLTEYAFR